MIKDRFLWIAAPTTLAALVGLIHLDRAPMSADQGALNAACAHHPACSEVTIMTWRGIPRTLWLRKQPVVLLRAYSSADGKVEDVHAVAADVINEAMAGIPSNYQLRVMPDIQVANLGPKDKLAPAKRGGGK